MKGSDRIVDPLLTKGSGSDRRSEKIGSSTSLPSEPLFLKLQLYLCQGNDLEASEVCQELSSMYEDMTAIDKVQTCLYQAELFCLTGNYPSK